MTRVASLGMYDLPHLHDANDRLWAAIAGRLRAAGLDDVPSGLNRERPLEEIWDDPGLLLAQTCGYPLMTRWRDRLCYVATPGYAVPGCEGTRYRSRIVVRRGDDLPALAACRGRRVAINDDASNSGMNLLRAAVAPLAGGERFFDGVVVTGSHAGSAVAVMQGVADVAAIDAVTFHHLDRAMPAVTAALTTIGWTGATPGLPFVTATGTSPAIVRLLRRALRAAIVAEPEVAAPLCLTRVDNIGVRRYAVIPDLERRAVAAGYPRLH